MILFIPISPIHILWSASLNLYLNSFPYDERRESADIINVFKESEYEFQALTNNNQFIGFVEIWNFNKFVFIEHLAISPEKQSRGYGSAVIKSISEIANKPVLLEAETPKDDLSHKRIVFYEKAGFKTLDIDYSQPPYYPGKKSVAMLLLSNRFVSLSDASSYISIISEKVYKIN